MSDFHTIRIGTAMTPGQEEAKNRPRKLARGICDEVKSLLDFFFVSAIAVVFGNVPATVVGQDESGSQHWAFRPVSRPSVPSTRNREWPLNPIDRFLLSRLEAIQRKPVATVERRMFLRRVTFNLTGLPPTPAELRRFVSDESANAVERVVDRLLASPHYGERWGRHWLDISRYADSNGLDENRALINAYHFRDYVVDAFNRDLPFDDFVQSQLAGDLLPEPERPSQVEDPTWAWRVATLTGDRLRATGFLSLGPKGLREVDPVKMEMDIIDDQVATVGKALLGLTLECARCHDHKFDPITTADYYALAGIFKSTRTMKQIVDKRGKGDGYWLEREIARTPLGSVKRVVESVMCVEEGSPKNLRIHVRGSHLELCEEVRRGLPKILSQQLAAADIGPGESGRLQLARWITDPRHPLTSRVIANRIWQWHFGVGLVQTPDNFGELGARPADPELLDWLASELVRMDWSIKRLSRMILLSRAYRSGGQGKSVADDESGHVLPASLCAAVGFPRRRLAAEEIRDSLLAVSGLLDSEMHGTLLTLKSRQYVNDAKTGRHLVSYTNSRRSIYQPVIRNKVYSLFQMFEFPSPSLVSGRRATTTVPPQLLLMMNSELVARCSQAMAVRMLQDSTLTEVERIGLSYEFVYGRIPGEGEVQRAGEFLRRFEQTLSPEQSLETRRAAAWQAFCQALMVSNEFVYLD